MYSKEERKMAIRLYIKYDKCVVRVIRELGYPGWKTLAKWYKAYLETGVLFKPYIRRPKYSLKKKAAIEYYLEHGRSLAKTIRALGYPSKETLRTWVNELVPGGYKKRVSGIQFTLEQKKEAVMALCTRTGTAKDVALPYPPCR